MRWSWYDLYAGYQGGLFNLHGRRWEGFLLLRAGSDTIRVWRCKHIDEKCRAISWVRVPLLVFRWCRWRESSGGPVRIYLVCFALVARREGVMELVSGGAGE